MQKASGKSRQAKSHAEQPSWKCRGQVLTCSWVLRISPRPEDTRVQASWIQLLTHITIRKKLYKKEKKLKQSLAKSHKTANLPLLPYINVKIYRKKKKKPGNVHM